MPENRQNRAGIVHKLEKTWILRHKVCVTPSHTQQIFELLVLQVSIGVEMI